MYRKARVAIDFAPQIHRNMAKCKNCGDVIESMSGHDFVTCSCFKDGTGIFVDGGRNHLRYGGNLDNFERLNPPPLCFTCWTETEWMGVESSKDNPMVAVDRFKCPNSECNKEFYLERKGYE